MQPLDGKVALVTGGSRGIGAAIVRQMASAGASVAFTYLSAADRARALVAELEAGGARVVSLQVDSADAPALADAVHQVAESFGRLDVLVNNAGVFPYGEPETFTLEEIDAVLAVHARAAFVAAQASAPLMTRGGRIISIGSCFVERVPVPGISLYAMSKAALTGLTKGLARDLGPRGITVNLVHPGPTDTDMNPADGAAADDERALTALGHYASPDDVAATVVHLASGAGRYVTGTAIAVDGGYAA